MFSSPMRLINLCLLMLTSGFSAIQASRRWWAGPFPPSCFDCLHRSSRLVPELSMKVVSALCLTSATSSITAEAWSWRAFCSAVWRLP
uniref:ORF 87b n=1 Tax=Lactococcus phage mv4 TaxID=12392 RepID=Q9G0C8_BPMV4|nr:ORF 87b [Lactobacillus phage mv4]